MLQHDCRDPELVEGLEVSNKVKDPLEYSQNSYISQLVIISAKMLLWISTAYGTQLKRTKIGLKR